MSVTYLLPLAMLRLFSCLIIVLSLIAAPVFAGLDNCVGSAPHQHAVSGETNAAKNEKGLHPPLHCCAVHAAAIASREHGVIRAARADHPLLGHDGIHAGENPSPLLEPPSHT